MDSPLNELMCIICRKEFSADSSDKPVRVTEGREKLLECCLQRSDSALCDYLLSNPSVINVHEDCRKQYQYIASGQVKRSGEEFQTAGQLKYLRSSGAAFDWKNKCFLCGKQAVIDRKHPQRNAVHEAKS